MYSISRLKAFYLTNTEIYTQYIYILTSSKVEHFFIPYDDANIIYIPIHHIDQNGILGPHSEYVVLLPYFIMRHRGNHHRKTLSEERKLFCAVNFKKLGCPMRSLSKLSNSKVCRPPGFLNF